MVKYNKSTKEINQNKRYTQRSKGGPPQKKVERERERRKLGIKNNKMMNSNLTISIIMLNVSIMLNANSLNTLIKIQIVRLDKKSCIKMNK